MIKCEIVNEGVGLSMDLYLDENAVEMLQAFYEKNGQIDEKDELTINPKTVEWIKEEKDFIAKAEPLCRALSIDIGEFAELFIRVIALEERKAAILCTQNYNTKEEFLERLYEYLEEFAYIDSKERIPPDILVIVYSYICFVKMGQSKIEIEPSLIPILLNVVGVEPDFNNLPEGVDESPVLDEEAEKIQKDLFERFGVQGMK